MLFIHCSRFREFLGSESIVALRSGCAGLYIDTQYRKRKEVRREAIGHKAALTIAVLNYTLLITRLILKARKHGVITRHEADYLGSMAQNSVPAASTRALVNSKGAPDFLYAALHFSTMIWQSGDADECDVRARAGYTLAQFVLSQESPGYDSSWATKLLRELYDAHAEPTRHTVGYAERRTASGLSGVLRTDLVLRLT